MKPEDLRWLDQVEPGWEAASLPFLALKDTFVSGDASAQRLLVRYFRCREDNTVCAKVLFGPQAQGPPGHVHGGGMAAILDEAMGGAAWLSGYPVVAAQLNLTFAHMLPIGTRAVAHAEVTSVTGRKVHTLGTLSSSDGTVEYCRGTGLFITLDPGHLDHLPQAAADIVAKATNRSSGHQS